MEHWKDWNVLKTNPRDESRKSKAAYVDTAVVLCVCVCVSSLVFFPEWEKRAAIMKIALSVVSAIKRAEHACAVLVAREGCRIAVGHYLERGDLKSAAEAIFA